MEGLTNEFLSEVLGFDAVAYYISEISGRGKTVVVDTVYDDHITQMYINIYELAHKCKEWAYENGFIIFSSAGTMECYIDGRMFIDGKDVRFLASSEPEAIFKACQWIMEQKDK